MNHEDIKKGMFVKYYDHEHKRNFVAEVIGTDEWIDDNGHQCKQVLIDDPMIAGRIISIGAGELKERTTHCWGRKCNGMLDSKTMPYCEKCSGIICPKCGGCLCGYKKSSRY